MAVPTKDAVLPNDAPESLFLEKHIDFIAKYGQVINDDSIQSFQINTENGLQSKISLENIIVINHSANVFDFRAILNMSLLCPSFCESTAFIGD
jgi:hypothetical protein